MSLYLRVGLVASNGQPVEDVVVRVAVASTATRATIYEDEAGANPIEGAAVLTMADGTYQYWVAPGEYLENLIKPEILSRTRTVQIYGTPEPLDTRPRYGVGGALLATDAVGIAAMFAAMFAAPASANGSRVAGSSGAALTVTPTGTNYGWFACLLSAVGSGVTFNTSLGTQGWNGAGLAGQNTGASPIPSPTYILHIDANGNVWALFRQDYYAAPVSFWTT
jgi:hypothetical protein